MESKSKIKKKKSVDAPKSAETVLKPAKAKDMTLKLETTFEDALMVIAKVADKPRKVSSEKKPKAKKQGNCLSFLIRCSSVYYTIINL